MRRIKGKTIKMYYNLLGEFISLVAFFYKRMYMTFITYCKSFNNFHFLFVEAEQLP